MPDYQMYIDAVLVSFPDGRTTAGWGVEFANPYLPHLDAGGPVPHDQASTPERVQLWALLNAIDTAKFYLDLQHSNAHLEIWSYNFYCCWVHEEIILPYKQGQATVDWIRESAPDADLILEIIDRTYGIALSVKPARVPDTSRPEARTAGRYALYGSNGWNFREGCWIDELQRRERASWQAQASREQGGIRAAAIASEDVLVQHPPQPSQWLPQNDHRDGPGTAGRSLPRPSCLGPPPPSLVERLLSAPMIPPPSPLQAHQPHFSAPGGSQSLPLSHAAAGPSTPQPRAVPRGTPTSPLSPTSSSAESWAAYTLHQMRTRVSETPPSSFPQTPSDGTSDHHQEQYLDRHQPTEWPAGPSYTYAHSGPSHASPRTEAGGAWSHPPFYPREPPADLTPRQHRSPAPPPSPLPLAFQYERGYTDASTGYALWPRSPSMSRSPSPPPLLRSRSTSPGGGEPRRRPLSIAEMCSPEEAVDRMPTQEE